MHFAQKKHDYLPIFLAKMLSVLYIRTWRRKMAQKPFEELTIADDFIL